MAGDTGQLDALCEQAGVPVEGSYWDVIGVREMNRRVPGPAKWARSIVIVVVITAAIIAISIALVGPSSR